MHANRPLSFDMVLSGKCGANQHDKDVPIKKVSRLMLQNRRPFGFETSAGSLTLYPTPTPEVNNRRGFFENSKWRFVLEQAFSSVEEQSQGTRSHQNRLLKVSVHAVRLVRSIFDQRGHDEVVVDRLTVA